MPHDKASTISISFTISSLTFTFLLLLQLYQLPYAFANLIHSQLQETLIYQENSTTSQSPILGSTVSPSPSSISTPLTDPNQNGHKSSSPSVISESSIKFFIRNPKFSSRRVIPSLDSRSDQHHQFISPRHRFIGFIKLKSLSITPWLRVTGLVALLFVLLYILGSTASDYFSITLDNLSRVLELSPSVAGVTLLAIGNGAPDAFSSAMAFATSDSGTDIGFSSVLGGALFVTTVVSGLVSIISSRKYGDGNLRNENPAKTHGSACFCDKKDELSNDSVSSSEQISGNNLQRNCCCKEERSSKASDIRDPESITCNYEVEGPVIICHIGEAALEDGSVKIESVYFVRDVIFLLASVGIITAMLVDGKVHLWEAISFTCIYPVYVISVWGATRYQSRRYEQLQSISPLLDPLLKEGANIPQNHNYNEIPGIGVDYLKETSTTNSSVCKSKQLFMLLYKYGIELPLAIPRMLTIPMPVEGRWSRPLAVTSCILAPPFAGGLWIYEYGNSIISVSIVLGVTSGIGMLLGLIAFLSTNSSKRPVKCLWLWLSGSFIMSILWFCLVADMLVATLTELANIFGISSSILGFSVLAWGNCTGDLMADTSLARADRDGAKIAISGCYAGPIFNTVMGLGLSLVIGCWRSSPDPLDISYESNILFYIVGFLSVGLLWSLIIMPINSMRLNRSFGGGLIVIYCAFIVTSTCYLLQS